jgi:hypothetical protein
MLGLSATTVSSAGITAARRLVQFVSVGILNAIFEPRVHDADCLITPIPQTRPMRRPQESMLAACNGRLSACSASPFR